MRLGTVPRPVHEPHLGVVARRVVSQCQSLDSQQSSRDFTLTKVAGLVLTAKKLSKFRKSVWVQGTRASPSFGQVAV